MTRPIATLQERFLTQNAADEEVYQDLLFFHAARRAQDKLGALVADLDPSNESDLLVFELFQGTEPRALLALADAEDAPWIRYCLMKAFLQAGATEEALAFWKKILQWQVPDTLTANTLLQYALREGRFEEAGNIAAVSLKVAPKQRDVLLWKAMAQSKRTLDTELYLDPLPKPFDVTLALRSGPDADHLALAAEAILAQNYPLAEVIFLEEPGAPGWPRGLDLQPRVLPLTSGRYWIGAALEGCNTPLLLTVPPGCVPTFDYTQACMLAAENAAPGLALTAGRVEDLHQDKPGDCWRVARLSRTYSLERSTDSSAIDSEALCLNVELLRPTLEVPWQDAPALAHAAAARDLAAVYLPEAVALDLREDTIQSAIEAYWSAELPRRNETGVFDSALALVKGFSEHRERAATFMNQSIAEGSSTLIFPDFLYFYQSTALDLRHAVETGLLDAKTAGRIQARLIEALAPLDAAFKRNLRDKVRKSLGDLAFSPAADTAIPAEVDRPLDDVLQELATLLRAFPQDLYLALIG